jgi:ABC-type glycerol-3-phosphate transport system substrate-binding protein
VNRTRVALATVCLGLLVAACGGGAASSGASQASPTPTLQPTAATSGPALPSLPSSAKDLEELIPDEIGGVALQKFSMQGDEFVNSGGATEDTQQFLEGLGVSTDDVAVAAGFSIGTADALAIFVFRAEGAGSDRLVTVFKQATDADRDAPLEWESATVGGKQVERASDPDQNNQVVYLYANGDLLFFLASGKEENAAEALEALP